MPPWYNFHVKKTIEHQDLQTAIFAMGAYIVHSVPLDDKTFQILADDMGWSKNDTANFLHLLCLHVNGYEKIYKIMKDMDFSIKNSKVDS